MRTGSIAALVLSIASPASAQYCRPQAFAGVYGYQLSGTTTISGDTKPVASVGRLEFDGRGTVSGTASVNFAGFLLGNPVTGTYQVRADCSITWSLQDDSGAFQHFAGKLNSDLERATFQQTDAGGAQRGTLAKAARDCSVSRIRGAYDLSISGNTFAMNPGETARSISVQGALLADGNGNLTRLEHGATIAAGTVTVDPDCTVNMILTPSEGMAISSRGVSVNGGREILAIVTDPGATVNVRLLAR